MERRGEKGLCTFLHNGERGAYLDREGTFMSEVLLIKFECMLERIE